MSSGEEHPVNSPLRTLIDEWCERRELKSLSVLLPAYTSNNVLTDGWAEVMEALRTLRAIHGLPQNEQAEISRLLILVEQLVYRP